MKGRVRHERARPSSHQRRRANVEATERNHGYGLDLWFDSEHGGERNRDGEGNYGDDPKVYPTNPILGAEECSGAHREMWRRQSLTENVLPDILSWRGTYSSKLVGSGLLWNVPGLECCSTGIVAFDASAISGIEYQFDASDDDTSREGEVSPYAVLTKQNGASYEWVDGEKVSTGLDHEDANFDAGSLLRLDTGHVRPRSLRETTITVTAARQIGEAAAKLVRAAQPRVSWRGAMATPSR